MTSIEKVETGLLGDHGRYSIERHESGRGAVSFQLFLESQPPRREHWQDYYVADTLELARAILTRARVSAAAGKRPNLQAIAADLKRRLSKTDGFSRAGGSQRRVFGGGVILGDTAPDELPGVDLVQQLRDGLPS